MDIKCPNCRGTGFDSGIGQMCIDCAGLGRLKNWNGIPGHAISDEIGCPNCRGSGFADGGVCIDCGGTGRLHMR